MNRLQTVIDWTAALTQMGHIFCCGLPFVFSAMSLLSSFGIMVTLPFDGHSLDHMMHDYAAPFLTFATIVLLIGWGLHFVSWKIDCLSTGCGHKSCAPKKKRSGKILLFSTVLFAANLLIFMTENGSH